MTLEEFRRRGHELVDWMADFYDTIEERPVRAQVEPGEIMKRLPEHAPEDAESFDRIFRDFQEIVLPGMTHWQHPSFFAYFPANSSYPSVLAEMLTATLAAQCMSWQTSPAATELEERIMEWLRDILGLPAAYEGVIQDSASSSTLVSILTARERATGYQSNEHGLQEQEQLVVYASSQTHSSIEKAVKIAGLGVGGYRVVETDADYAMDPEALEQAVQADRAAGRKPCCVVATIGTTGSTAVDPLRRIGEICREHGLWLHVDAALAGSALVLPEQRWMIDGIEYADTFVFNPHKWLFTNFDCSAYFVRDKKALLQTLEIHPEYLKTKEGRAVNNYRDWSVSLGRRFRALKLWFVIRSYGVSGMRTMIRSHIDLAAWVAEQVRTEPDFELLAPVPLNTVCFRYNPARPEGASGAESGEASGATTGADAQSDSELNGLNAQLLERLNSSGKLYMTHTKLSGRYTIRFVVGQTFTERKHVQAAWELVKRQAREISG